jgi:hypothetical protein
MRYAPHELGAPNCGLGTTHEFLSFGMPSVQGIPKPRNGHRAPIQEAGRQSSSTADSELKFRSVFSIACGEYGLLAARSTESTITWSFSKLIRSFITTRLSRLSRGCLSPTHLLRALMYGAEVTTLKKVYQLDFYLNLSPVVVASVCKERRAIRWHRSDL